MITPPCSYQGGKQRLAKKIIDIIKPSGPFYDLCCGSGSISIELINRGYNPKNIVMLDAGPWGLVWEFVGKGEFDLSKFRKICDSLPQDRKLLQGHIKEISKCPAPPIENGNIDAVYIFLLLQAASFGSKAIWIKDGKWQNCSFRSYWEPTATSNRRSPVNPMMPMPETLFARMEKICESMKGVFGYHLDISECRPKGTTYIDPPYAGLTKYGHTFDIMKYVSENCHGIDVYVSEGKPLGESCYQFTSEAKGGISGVRNEAHKEFLTYFKANCIC